MIWCTPVLGDVDGTLEALLQIFSTYDNSRCHLNLLQYGVGDVTEQDIDMAASFNGNIYHVYGQFLYVILMDSFMYKNQLVQIIKSLLT